MAGAVPVKSKVRHLCVATAFTYLVLVKIAIQGPFTSMRQRQSYYSEEGMPSRSSGKS
jgi:hypothetical protein